MPILNYKCLKCGEQVERYFKHKIPLTCPKCTAPMKLVPSKMGYRRDRTVL